MDNFDFNSPKKKFPGSVDGFVNGKPKKGNNLRSFDMYYRPNQQNANSGVDKFRSVDGFTPMAQPAIQNPAAEGKPEEIAFEPEDTKQRHERPGRHSARLKGRSHRRRFSLFRRKKHEKAEHKHSKLRIALRTSAVLGAFILLVGGGLLLRGFLAGRNIFKGGGNSAVLNNQNVDPSLLKGEGDGRINILVLGKGGEGHAGADLTDTIMIASIDPIAKEAALLSIPRDFWVKSPSGYQSKVNQVYYDAKTKVLNGYEFKQRDSDEAKNNAEKAGLDALKKVLSDVVGVPIHYHAMIDFTGFRKAIDTVGGIDINVTQEQAVKETLWVDGRSYSLNVPAGQQHFDGLKALMFSRSRKVSSSGTYARDDRQRAVIVALKDKVLSAGTLANPLKLNQLISDFGNHISTDFSTNEIMRVYDLAKEIPSDRIASIDLNEHVEGDMINGLSVQVPKAGLFDYSEIQNYVRNAMRDSFLKSEDAKLMLLNGTDRTGLATTKSKELKSFGYNVISVADAPSKNYQNTVIVDLTRGKKRYTLSYLEKRFGVKAVNVLPDANINPGSADFVIILGSDIR